MLDLIVVGAGLSGMLAGTLAARRGLAAMVIAQGVGATHVGAGCVDVLGYDSQGKRLIAPPDALARLIRASPAHPYALAGLEALQGGLAELQAVCEAAGYPLSGELSANYWLPTSTGAIRPTCLAPESFVAGEVRRADPITLCALPGFRDYQPAYAAENLRRQRPGLAVEVREAALPDRPRRREAYATDLARLLDDANYRAKVTKNWIPQLAGARRIGFPAVLGLNNGPAARKDLAERLSADVFEIPLLPPSVPGMRLFQALAGAFEQAGGRLVLGPTVTGTIDGTGAAPTVRGVVAEAAGRQKEYRAGAVMLATGGFLGGGLVSERAGTAAEAVFDLPIVTQAAGQPWFNERLFGPQPYARFGVRVNSAMRPLDAGGATLYDNLYAVGELLAGADRLSEGSREGISVASAYKAVTALAGG